MADQLEEVKRKVDLIELISEYVPLKKIGRNFKALCPFHSEKTPSFIVSPERQIWKCFGCGAGGDHFRFLMEIESLEFGEALRTLAKRAGVKLRSYRPSGEEKVKQLFWEINHLASEFFHYLLLHHRAGKAALDYILGRGIKRQSLELFKLGFSPASWDSLQKFLIGKKGYRPQDLEKVGLIIRRPRGSGYYDRFRGRLMFPLKDHRDNVAGFAGRVLDPTAKEAKYVNTPETPVYHKSDLLYGLVEAKKPIKQADEVILVEGELDLISSVQAGVANVVAIKGSALSDRQVQLLGRLTSNITFALDQDVAGDAAARRGIQVADVAGMNIKVVQLQGGKDPDEVAQKGPGLWRRLVKEAVPVYDYFFASALARYDAQAVVGKRQIAQELVPVLAQVSDEIVRSFYVRRLAEELEVDEAAILVQIQKQVGSPQAGLAKEALVPSPVTKSRREVLEEYLLALAFQANQWRFLRQRKAVRSIKTPRLARIVEALGDYLKRYKTWVSERLAKSLPPELKPTFDQLYLVDVADLLESEEKLAEELAKTLFRLEKLTLKEALSLLARKMKALEKKAPLATAEKKQLKALDQEFRQLSQDLSTLVLTQKEV